MKAKLITIIVILAILLLFILQNQRPLTIKFLFFGGETSIAIILLTTFLAGLVSGIILMFFKKR
jgi:uncharacterized integral membrane protein